MPLWGTEDTLEGKPKIHGRSLLDATQTPGQLDPRTGIYATTAGWVQQGVGRTGKDVMPEVLVAIRGLSERSSAAEGFGGTAMVEANITSFNWNISSYSRAAGGTLSVTANFNERVTVTGTPRLTVVNDSRTNHTLDYDSGSTTNRLTFTLVIAAGHSSLQATDVISVGANAIAQNGGSTIKDTLSTNNAVITNSAGIGTATGTITAAA
tara:strand:+ start:568 stop:1194 length:627 start_codon:yes stop_codon:yes gene_type:complete